MKKILTILFILLSRVIFAQGDSRGYILARPDGSPILLASSIDDSLLKNNIQISKISGLQNALDAKLATNGNGSQLTGLTKAQVGLANVDNTSDANKPISTVTQTALDSKQAFLVSGTNIKTINNQSLLGSGNIAIAGGAEAFPIGAVFLSVVSTNPNTLLGYGVWTQIAGGRMLVGQTGGDPNFDTAEETGGSSTVTVSAANLPQLSVSVTDPGHTHLTQRYPTTTGGSSGFTVDASMSGALADNTLPVKSSTTGITATANTGSANTAVNIQNPYFVVYIWKRTN